MTTESYAGRAPLRVPRCGVAVSLIVGTAILAGTPFTVAAQQGSIAGTVVSAETRQPLPDVSVQVVGTGRGVFTNELGRFTLGNLQGPEVQLHSR